LGGERIRGATELKEGRMGILDESDEAIRTGDELSVGT